MYYLTCELGSVPLAGVRCTEAVLLHLEAVEGPVAVIEAELLLLVGVIGVDDAGLRAVHADDQLGVPLDLAFVERPDPDGHLEILLLPSIPSLGLGSRHGDDGTRNVI